MRPILLLLMSVAALAILIWSLTSRPRRNPESTTTTVRVFCAASNRAVMEAVRQDYEVEFGTRLEVQYGPSQTLLGTIEVSGTGDLYLPADDSYLNLATEKGLIKERIPLATMQLVVAVPRGNPRRIQSFADLVTADVKVLQANPDAAAVGKMTREILSEQALWETLDQHTEAYLGTVTEVANSIKVGAADAGIVYDAVLHTYPELEAVHLKEFEKGVASIEVGIIADTKQPAAALHFARYLGARDKGLQRYRDFGFTPVEGDVWADVPELTIYAGSMLRPAIEETIKAFESREGVEVTRIYNGCGILVAQMKGGQHPDAYFACDREFMSQVNDLFPESTDVSTNQLVILVQKGNPHVIQSLKDLAKPGLQVGIGHEKLCAMGWLTQQTFKEGNVQTEVMKNVTVQSPTGDTLVNQLKAGSLDAAVAYLSNAAGSADVLDAIPIQGIPCAEAVQPFGVAVDSEQKHLARRLYQRIAESESKERFLRNGFDWKLEEPRFGED